MKLILNSILVQFGVSLLSWWGGWSGWVGVLDEIKAKLKLKLKLSLVKSITIGMIYGMALLTKSYFH